MAAFDTDKIAQEAIDAIAEKIKNLNTSYLYMDRFTSGFIRSAAFFIIRRPIILAQRVGRGWLSGRDRRIRHFLNAAPYLSVRIKTAFYPIQTIEVIPGVFQISKVLSSILNDLNRSTSKRCCFFAGRNIVYFDLFVISDC